MGEHLLKEEGVADQHRINNKRHVTAPPTDFQTGRLYAAEPSRQSYINQTSVYRPDHQPSPTDKINYQINAHLLDHLPASTDQTYHQNVYQPDNLSFTNQINHQ